MPWKENSVLDQRLQFIALYLSGTMSVTDLCHQFGISRTTGYKYIDRYKEHGPSGLMDQSRATHTHPNATDGQTRRQIIELRTQHPNWGPKKIRAILMRESPETHYPATSTIGELLKSNGLVTTRRRRRSACSTPACDLSDPNAPNSVWTADFKGQFRLQNNQMCYPLTICDGYSRMILKCQALCNTALDPAKAVWVATFREYGLPQVIRTDNGSPFASVALGGLSRLSAWWIRLGVRPERIRPGNPQQNGSHERMHRTLDQDVTSQPQVNPKLQQLAFDDFVHEFNYFRPHEALDQQVPASLYSRSTREYPLVLPQLQYPEGTTIRHVRTSGEIRWRGGRIFLSETLIGEHVALDQVDDGQWALYYGFMPLAILDDRNRRWLPPKQAETILAKLRKETP